MDTVRPSTVVVGGGFAGINLVKGLRRVDVAVTLIVQTNFHLFQPLLYQVATAALSPANISPGFRTLDDATEIASVYCSRLRRQGLTQVNRPEERS